MAVNQGTNQRLSPDALRRQQERLQNLQSAAAQAGGVNTAGGFALDSRASDLQNDLNLFQQEQMARPGTAAGQINTMRQQAAAQRLGRSTDSGPSRFERQLAEQEQKRLLNLYEYDPRAFNVPLNLQGPEAAATPFNLAQMNETRARQIQLADLLNQSAAGTGPSIAETAGARQAENLQRQLLASQLGRPGVGVARQALFAGAQAGADIANQTAMARLQEQQDAQRALGQFLGVTREQDFASAQAQAQLEQQRRLANLESTLQTQAKQAELQSRLQELRGRDVLALNTQPQQQRRAPWWQGALTGVLQGGATALAAFGLGGLGGGAAGAGGAAGGAATTSDKNAKKDIKPAGSELDRLLNEMSAQSYSYKDPADGEGRRVGVMAQDLEQSALGKLLVSDTPNGKTVDLTKMLPLLLASQVRLNERLNKLEG